MQLYNVTLHIIINKMYESKSSKVRDCQPVLQTPEIHKRYYVPTKHTITTTKPPISSYFSNNRHTCLFDITPKGPGALGPSYKLNFIIFDFMNNKLYYLRGLRLLYFLWFESFGRIWTGKLYRVTIYKGHKHKRDACETVSLLSTARTFSSFARKARKQESGIEKTRLRQHSKALLMQAFTHTLNSV